MSKIILFSFFLCNVYAWNPNNYPFIPASADSTKIREMIIEAQGENKRILDIGCGKGYSTASSPGSLGIDSSKHNIKAAQKQFPNKKFKHSLINNEKDESEEYDVVTSMFYLNNIPQHLRKKTIDTAIEIAKERVVVVDIDPDYQPDKNMLTKRIYLPDYMKNCRNDLILFDEQVLVDGLLTIWVYNKKDDMYNKILKHSNNIYENNDIPSSYNFSN
tara:strand:+ start:3181 stop:3831 length:651 start_codon:yes stop_codon:yes gene_type:complete